jgi:CheY-like chemotaxis protein
MKSKLSFRTRFLVAMMVPIVVILIVLLYPNLPEGRWDTSTLFLVVLVVLVLLLPLEQITSLKAAGVEISLDQAKVDRAIETVKGQGKNIVDERLRNLLKRLEPQIEQASGSRILWIDDQPYNVLGERRLLRALGIEIVMAESTETAREYLRRDGDFDLLISDVRGKEKDPPEAIQFVNQIREKEEERRRAGNYAHIPLVPVVFYSGRHWKEYYGPIQDLRSEESCVVWTSGVEQFVREVLHLLHSIRLEPMRFVQNPDRPTPEENFSPG